MCRDGDTWLASELGTDRVPRGEKKPPITPLSSSFVIKRGPVDLGESIFKKGPLPNNRIKLGRRAPGARHRPNEPNDRTGK
jgi:hypothetical protein